MKKVKLSYKKLLKQILALLLFTASNLLAQCPQSSSTSNQYGTLAPTNGATFRAVPNYRLGNYFLFPMLNGGSYSVSTCGTAFDTQITGYDNSASTVLFFNEDNGPLCSGSNASYNAYVPNFTNYAKVLITEFSCQAVNGSSIVVYLRQNDNLSFTSSSASMCSGEKRALTATPANVGSSPGGFGDPGTFSGTGVSGTTFTAPYVTIPTTYTITYTFGYVSKTQTITVLPSGIASVSSSATKICEGNSITLTAVPNSNSTVTWSNGVINGVAFMPSLTQTYSAYGLNSSNGCRDTSQITVIVNDSPNDQILSIDTTTICSGNTVHVSLVSSEKGKKYKLINTSNNTVLSSSVKGTGAALSITSNALSSSVNVGVLAELDTLDGAVNFDGTNDYISANTSITSTKGTWEAWVYKTNWADHHDDRLFGNGIDYDTPNSFQLSLHPIVGLHFRYGSSFDAGNNYTNSLSTQSLVAGSWHHIAATWDKVTGTTTIKIYIDGVLSGTATSTANISFGPNIYFGGGGSNPASNYFGSGKMNEVQLWNVARTQAQIQSDMATYLVGNEASLLSYWPLDELSGTSALDYTFFNNTATLNNMSPGSEWFQLATSKPYCSKVFSQTFAVTVNTIPSTPSTISGSSSICVNSTGMYTVSPVSGATSYAWTLPVGWTGTSATNSINVSSNTSAGTISVTAANSCGTSSSVSKVITINPYIVTANASATNICEGSSITLTGGGATNYSWSGGVTNGAAFAPSSTSLYTLVGSDATGCSNTAQVSVFVTPAIVDQTVSASPSSICSGNTSTINLGSSENGVKYTLINTANSASLSSTIAGTGSALSLTSNALTANTTIGVKAEVDTINGALQFDGTNDYLSANTTNSATEGTWESWVNKADWTDHHDDVLFGNGIPFGASNSFYISLHPAVGFHFRYGGTGDAGSIFVSSLYTQSLQANSWHHLAASWKNVAGTTTIKIYLDGILLNTATSTATINFGSLAYMGGTPTSNYFGNGKLDEIKLWNTERTLSQIISDITNTPIGNESGLISYWPLNDASGSATANDITSANNDATLNNMNVNASWVSHNKHYCSKILSQTQAITVLPNTLGTIAGASTICASSSNTYTVPAITGATSYNWTIPSGWTGTSTTNSITVTPNATGGTISVTATTSLCGLTPLSSKIITVTSVASSISSQTNVLCNGALTGAATVLASGGTSSYTYSWAPSGGTAATANSLAAGTYTCTITDANSCTKTQTVTITQPASALSATTSQVNVLCNGASTGSASVAASGGTGSYTYAWSPSGGTAATASGLAAGSYTCTISDANSCSVTKTFTISQPTSGLSATTTQVNVLCNGASTGSASVATSGGTSTYTYAWAPSGGTAATASGLAAGSYTCTISDANSCSITKIFSITQPAFALSATTTQVNVLCNGASTGSASVATSGGTSTYTYIWAPSGGTASTASGLAAGSYTCTISDANSCSITKIFSITQPAFALSATTTQVNVLCNGASTGSASVVASGGTSAYTYAWSPSGGTAATASGLAAGSYTCTITDANSCSITKTFNLTQNTAITANSSSTLTSCAGNTGTATVSAVTGGAGSYTYSWSPSGGTAATATGLSVGSYTCTITDASSCSITKSVIVNAAGAPSLTTNTQTNVTCNGLSNGSASVNAATGGSPSYTYAWSPSGGTGLVATGLSAGTYSCTVTDANSCTAVQTFTITQPAVLNASMLTQTNVTCNGASSGAASVSVSGGTTSYTYDWLPGTPTGDGTASVSSLSAGTYTCNVTDANSCSTSQVFTLTEPSALIATTSQTNILCNGASSGSATVNASGGTGSYTYTWLPSGGFASTANSLAAGSYTCTITDVNSCSISKSFVITEPSILSATTSQVNVLCNGASTGSASVAASGGTSAYTYAWLPSGGTAATANGLVAGLYTCTITDANSCSITKVVTITEASVLSATIASQTNVLCNAASTGSATIATTGGTASYTYSWTSGGASATETGLAAGTYTCNITDANSCSTTQTVTITEPSAITITTASTTAPSCGTNNGAATIDVTGGVAGYNYVWSSGGTNSTETGLAAGNYTVTVTDANSCTASHTVSLSNPGSPTIAGSVVTNAGCAGDNQGAIVVTVTTGVSYSVVWNNTATTEDLTGLVAGNYDIIVTDINNCIATANFTITELPLPNVFAGANQTVCAGTSVLLDATGNAISYSWDNSVIDSLSFVPTTTLNYIVTGMDDNGCNNADTVTVTVNVLPTVTLSLTGADTLCSNAGMIALSGETPTGGNWTGAGVTGTNFDAATANLGWNLITYSYTDANTCSANASDSVFVSACVGINEIELYQYIECYPNPTVGIINVKAREINIDKVEVVDILGKTLENFIPIASDLIRVDLTNYPNGIYLIKFSCKNGVVTQRVIKEN